MKRVLFFVALLVVAMQAKSQEQANWNVANYYAYDTTTFFLGAAKDVKWITVDFTSVDADDIVLFVGMRDKDGQGVGNLFWDGSTSNPDSVILNRTTYARTIRTSAGTRYTTSRVYFWFSDGLPDDYLSFTFVWGSAQSGRIKVYYGGK